MSEERLYPPILVSSRRRDAWDRYAEKFGEGYPEALIYQHGDDGDADIADIDRCIKQNKKAVAPKEDEEIMR